MPFCKFFKSQKRKFLGDGIFPVGPRVFYRYVAEHNSRLEIKKRSAAKIFAAERKCFVPHVRREVLFIEFYS